MGDGEAEDVLGMQAERLGVGGCEGGVLPKGEDAVRVVERLRGERKEAWGGRRRLELGDGAMDKVRVVEHAELQRVLEDEVQVAGFGDEVIPPAEGGKRPGDVLEGARARIDPLVIVRCF